MNQDIQFVNFPKSSFVFDFIRNKVKRHIRILPASKSDLKIVLKRENDSETSNGKEEYICEIIYLHNRKKNIVEKRSSNLYRAIAHCFTALKSIPNSKKTSKPYTRKERRIRLAHKKKPSKILVA